MAAKHSLGALFLVRSVSLWAPGSVTKRGTAQHFSKVAGDKERSAALDYQDDYPLCQPRANHSTASDADPFFQAQQNQRRAAIHPSISHHPHNPCFDPRNVKVKTKQGSAQCSSALGCPASSMPPAKILSLPGNFEYTLDLYKPCLVISSQRPGPCTLL